MAAELKIAIGLSSKGWDFRFEDKLVAQAEKLGATLTDTGHGLNYRTLWFRVAASKVEDTASRLETWLDKHKVRDFSLDW